MIIQGSLDLLQASKAVKRKREFTILKLRDNPDLSEK
jgi:hypothetical protein